MRCCRIRRQFEKKSKPILIHTVKLFYLTNRLPSIPYFGCVFFNAMCLTNMYLAEQDTAIFQSSWFLAWHYLISVDLTLHYGRFAAGVHNDLSYAVFAFVAGSVCRPGRSVRRSGWSGLWSVRRLLRRRLNFLCGTWWVGFFLGWSRGCCWGRHLLANPKILTELT